MRFHIGILLLMGATAITAYGQASPACGANKLTAFSTEQRVPYSGVLTTIPTNPTLFPYVPGLVDGSLEIRVKLLYQQKGSGRVILANSFIIESDFPFPTSDQDRQDYGTEIETATLGIDHIYTSCSPVPSVMFTGTVTQTFPKSGDVMYPGEWNMDVTGAKFELSTGFTTQSNPNPPGASYCAGLYPSQSPLFNVTETLAGVGVEWAPCALGTLTFRP